MNITIRIEELERLEPEDFHCSEARSYAMELIKALKQLDKLKADITELVLT